MLSYYFDPGLGAMLIQAFVAAVAGFVVFSKNLKTNIKNFLFGKSTDYEPQDSINVQEDNDEQREESTKK